MHTTIEPFRFEAEIYDCETVGNVPKQLSGSFYRCGGDALYPTLQNDNLNNGDGVVAAFHFQNGYVDFIQRYVKTERFLLERKNRRRLYGRSRRGKSIRKRAGGGQRKIAAHAVAGSAETIALHLGP